MRYMATIYVSDVMESVALTVEVQEWSEQYGPPEATMRATYVWAGVGANDPLEWLARALFLAAEEVSKPAPGRVTTRAAVGGPHTLSGSGDTQI